MRILPFALLVTTLCSGAATAALAQSSPALLATNEAQTQTTTTKTTMAITGRVEADSGPLVGATVNVIDNPRLQAVTNSNGEFFLEVPATTEPVNIAASYAGYKAVAATVQPGDILAPIRLTETQPLPDLPRKLQLKRYIKVAQKEAKRESRQLRR